MNDEPERPTIDHSALSPSGRVSRRASAEAKRRTARELFPPGFWEGLPTRQPDRAEQLRNSARDLRELAARGMKTAHFNRQAAKMEAEAAAIEAQRRQPPKEARDE